jgi:hypothetical protein
MGKKEVNRVLGFASRYYLNLMARLTRVEKKLDRIGEGIDALLHLDELKERHSQDLCGVPPIDPDIFGPEVMPSPENRAMSEESRHSAEAFNEIEGYPDETS